jgi:hypothetical protein
MELVSTKHTLSLPLTFILFSFSFFCLCLFLTASYLLLLTTFYLYFWHSALISVLGIEEDGLSINIPLLWSSFLPNTLSHSRSPLSFCLRLGRLFPLSFLLYPFAFLLFLPLPVSDCLLPTAADNFLPLLLSFSPDQRRGIKEGTYTL